MNNESPFNSITTDTLKIDMDKVESGDIEIHGATENDKLRQLLHEWREEDIPAAQDAANDQAAKAYAQCVEQLTAVIEE